MVESSPHKKCFSDGETELVNLKEVSEDAWDVYIGRENSYYGLSESIFSNPYSTSEYERETAVRLYELWLFRQIASDDEFYDAFCELKSNVLACWCLPKSCHGEVLISAVLADDAGRLEEHINNRFEQLSVNLFGHTQEKEQTQDILSNAGVFEG